MTKVKKDKTNVKTKTKPKTKPKVKEVVESNLDESGLASEPDAGPEPNVISESNSEAILNTKLKNTTTMFNTFSEFIDDTYRTVDAFFNEDQNRLAEHHINSFNDFVDNSLEQVIEDNNSHTIYKFGFNSKRRMYQTIYSVKFIGLSIMKPVLDETNLGDSKIMYPNYARMKKLTYAAEIVTDIHQSLEELDPKTNTYHKKELPIIHKKSLGKLPIMVCSKYCSLYGMTPEMKQQYGECMYDKGGYFIVKGNEKILISQEKLRERKMYCFHEKNLNVCKIQTVPQEVSSFRKEVKLKMRNMSERGDKSINVNINILKQNDVNLFVLFRALGVALSDKDIIRYIVYDLDTSLSKNMIYLLNDTVNSASDIKSQSLAIEVLSSKIDKKHFIENEKLGKLRHTITYEKIMDNMFQGYSNPTSAIKKTYMLGLMTQRLLLFSMDIIKETDRDSFENKCVMTSGPLMKILFRNNFNNMIRDMEYTINKNIDSKKLQDLFPILDKKIKTQQLLESSNKQALSTGKWPGNSSTPYVGIAQSLSRISYLNYLSTIRRVASHTSKKMKNPTIRILHNSQYGYFCPNETPEGQSTGIIKTLALLTTITVEESPKSVIDFLFTNGMKEISLVDTDELIDSVKLIINGDFIGIHGDISQIYPNLRSAKRNGIISIYTSIVHNIEDNAIYIYTDGGRLMRPMYIVNDDFKTLRFTRTIASKLKTGELKLADILYNEKGHGCIEYICPMESDILTFAMDIRDLAANDRKAPTFKTYTHCDIASSMLFGPVSINVPFSNSNQGPRNVIQTSLYKQGMGVYASNYRERMDTIGVVSNNSQKLLVRTRGSKYVHGNDIPSGQNIILAIASFTGYNQEDSLIMNKGAIDRGLFNIDYYKTYQDETTKDQSAMAEQHFEKPNRLTDDDKIRTSNMLPGNYDKLGEDGFVKEGTHVVGGDIIIGKVLPLKRETIDDPLFKDASTMLKDDGAGIVDKVYVDQINNGYEFGKVRIRTNRPPTIGDKFSALCGQKGTLGNIMPHENMPYTKDGIVPDVISSPHGQPKRMTLAQLIEGIVGKLGLVLGCAMDGTPFMEIEPHVIVELLMELGHYRDSEVLYNGMTGEQMVADIFIIPNNFVRLKHMVDNKVFSRSRGPKQMLNKQPSEGRSRGGGLRIGEMERDCMVAHGATMFTRERMYKQSDEYICFLCDSCGRIAIANPTENLFECRYCPESVNFSKIEIPYCTKLMIHEMMANMISMDLITEKINSQLPIPRSIRQ